MTEETSPKVPLVLKRVFDVPTALVWSAITELDKMKQWYFPMLDSFKAEVGFETQFNVSNEGKDFLHLWKVVEVIPGRKIAYSWKYGGFPGDSIVSFEVFDESGTTRLRLVHTGLETFDLEKNTNLARDNFLMGWTWFLKSLTKYISEVS